MKFFSTVGDVLKEYCPPNLDITSKKTGISTTKSAHARAGIFTKAKWASFATDILQEQSSINEDTRCEPAYFTQLVTKVSSESGVQHEYITHIQGAVNHILRSLKIDLEFAEITTCQPKLICYPDSVCCTSKCQFFALTELKTPWALPVPSIHFDIVQESLISGQDNCYANAIAQIYGYMSFNHLRYGMLSNYDYIFFLRRSMTKLSEVEISPPVPRSEAIKHILLFLLIAMRDPMYTSPAGSPTTDDKLPAHEKYQILDISSDHFRLHEGFAITSAGNVVKGNLAGVTEQVVFKIKDMTVGHGIADDLIDEAEIYEQLERLQGTIIPLFYAHVDFNGFFRAIVIENCGVPIEPEQLIEKEEEVFESLQMIHARHVIHGDLRLENILISDEGNVVIIDFSKSQITRDKIAKEDEMKALRRLIDRCCRHVSGEGSGSHE